MSSAEQALPVMPAGAVIEAPPPQTISILRSNKELSAEIRKTVEYIETMASVLSVDVSQWDLSQVFSGPLGLITDRREINRRLKVHSDALENSIPPELVPDLKIVTEKFAAQLAKRSKSLQDEYTRSRDDYLNAAIRKSQEATNYVASAWEQTMKIQGLMQKVPLDIGGQIMKVAQDRFWKYSKIEGNYLIFSTRNDCVIVSKNPAVGQDYWINLGKFDFYLNMGDMKLQGKASGNNVMTKRGYNHPYMSQGPMMSVCFGDQSDHVHRALSEGRVSEVFEILAGLLCTYTIGSAPYEIIDAFQVAYNKTLPVEQRRKVIGLCGECSEYPRECRCGRPGAAPIVDEDEGTYCQVCETELDEDGECGDHWCSICEANVDGCGCCGDCENTEGNCECCSICESNNRETCFCCHDCGRSDEDCLRCRTCDGHPRSSRSTEPVHTDECDENPENQDSDEEQAVPVEPAPTPGLVLDNDDGGSPF